MPIILNTQHDDDKEEVISTDEVYESMFDESDEFTLEGETIYKFLSEVDFSDLFEDEEIREAELIDDNIIWLTADGEDIVESDDEDTETGYVEVEEIDGTIAAELVDMDDLVEMFYWWLENEYPTETLEERAAIALFMEPDTDEDDEENVDEAGGWKKGSFRKVRKRKGGVQLVNKMLGAMLNKEVITRARKGAGKGYRKGDYDKNPKGYAQGTSAGLRAYGAFLRKHAAQIKKSRKKVATARGVKVSDRIAATSDMDKKAATAKKRGKAASAKSKKRASAEAQNAYIQGMTGGKGLSGGKSTKKAAKKKGAVARARKLKGKGGSKASKRGGRRKKAVGESTESYNEALNVPGVYHNEGHRLAGLVTETMKARESKPDLNEDKD